MKINFQELQQQPSSQIQQKSLNQLFNDQSQQLKIRNSLMSINQTLPLNISYPYNLSRSLSPQNYQREMNSLKQQVPMSQSTLNFIKNSVEQQMIKRQKYYVISNKNKLINFSHQLITNSNSFNQKDSTSKQRIHDNPIRVQELIDSFNESIQQIKTGKSKEKDRNFNKSIKQVNKTQMKTKSFALNNLNHSKDNYKHKKCIQKCISTKQRHKLLQQAQITYHPQLIQNRYSNKTYNRNKKGNVYTNLYNDHMRISYKRSLQKLENQQIISDMHNSKDKYATSKVTRKMLKNYIPFYKRYDTQLQKTAKKLKRNLNDHEYDWKTGQKMYQPNLKLSQQTYKIYKNTQMQTLKKKQNDKDKKLQDLILQTQKKQHQLEQQQQSQIKDKYKKNQKSITNLPTTQKDSFSLSATRSIELSDNIKDRALQRIADIFFSTNNNYKKEVSQLSQLNHSQFQVLYPFLTSLQNYGSINRPLFLNLLKKYYQKLTLYDRAILKQQNEKIKKVNILKMQRIQQSSKQLTHHPVVNQRSLTLSRQKNRHIQALWYL